MAAAREGAVWRIDVGATETTAAFDPTPGDADAPVFVCAHGAGGHLADRGVVRTAEALRERGLHTVRFNFLYRERGIGPPDPMPRLTECFAAVVARTRAELGPRPLIIGGRSMGGRAASMMTAAGFACDGLLLLAYPLHPPGKRATPRRPPAVDRGPGVLRERHADDSLHRALMEAVLARVKPVWRMGRRSGPQLPRSEEVGPHRRPGHGRDRDRGRRLAAGLALR